MTIDEFTGRLAETPGPWTLTKRGSIRCGCDCPVTAVGAPGEGVFNFGVAGRRLGLSSRDRDSIVDAADNIVWRKFDPSLRQALLRATVEREK